MPTATIWHKPLSSSTSPPPSDPSHHSLSSPSSLLGFPKPYQFNTHTNKCTKSPKPPFPPPSLLPNNLVIYPNNNNKSLSYISHNNNPKQKRTIIIMAEHLASIFGTEKDRVNCPFYFKIGACRHGDRCSRLHNRPTISPTLLLSNIYLRPDMITPGVDPSGQPLDPRKIQQHFEDFYEDIFEELSKFGQIESLNVCDNLADHMIGNVYVQFREEDQAAAALAALHGRFYSGRPIIADFSPVTDFREATCRQFEENSCNRGGYCNFMHVKLIGRELRRKLFGRYRDRGGGYRGSRSRSRSSSPRHRRERDYERREREKDYRRSRDRHDRYDRDRGRRRYGSPGGRRSGSPPPAREGSEERRARIEQWNREREEKQ